MECGDSFTITSQLRFTVNTQTCKDDQNEQVTFIPKDQI